MDDDIVARLRKSDGGVYMRQMFAEAADEIQRLRRMHCEGQAATIVGRTPQQMAENLGWDCFKEDE